MKKRHHPKHVATARILAAAAAVLGLCLCLPTSCLRNPVIPGRGNPVGEIRGSEYSPLVSLPLDLLALPETSAGAAHPVYRHSVVPGGVYSADDVRAAEARWGGVREHYRSVDVAALVPEKTPKAESYHVSYKKDGAIYWTSYKVPIPEGEPVLCDGKEMIRIRCGNRLSLLPLEPVLPRHREPAALDFEIPDLPFREAPLAGMGRSSLTKWTLPLGIIPLILPSIPHHTHELPDTPVVPGVDEAPTWAYLIAGLGLLLTGMWVRGHRP